MTFPKIPMKISSFIVNKHFKKQFSKLNRKIQDAFEDRARVFIKDETHPSLNNHPLHREWDQCWSINITGDVRAIYRLEKNIAVFMAIGTHSELYE